MNRLALLFFSLATSALWAESQFATVRISTDAVGGWFYVDEVRYTNSVVFSWPKGSKHFLRREDHDVFNPGRDTLYSFPAWKDSNGLLIPATAIPITITADPTITSYTLTGALVGYRTVIKFYNSDSKILPACAAPAQPLRSPEPGMRPGIIYINPGPVYYEGHIHNDGTLPLYPPDDAENAANIDDIGLLPCIWRSVVVYLKPGPYILNAFPYTERDSGFVFLGWSINLGPPDAYLRTVNVQGPLTIAAYFALGKRVTFYTSPAHLKVLVDRAETDTVDPGWDPLHSQFPIPGFFDFADGSKHVLAANTPQYDAYGTMWAFDSWSIGGGQNTVYTTQDVRTADSLTAKFVRAATASFLTNPVGLKLTVDDRQNWPAYNFNWGVGTTHTVSAAAQQKDAKGRTWVFNGWSNKGDATQSLTVTDDWLNPGFRIIANYTLLGQVTLKTNPAGIALQVDNAPCPTPCTLDRAEGSQVRVTAPQSTSVTDASRIDFRSWSDGGTADRVITFGTDALTLTANYQTVFALRAWADPAGGSSIVTEPGSADNFYPAGSQLKVTALPKPGYRFRRWDGDVNSTSPVIAVNMSAPAAVRANLDPIPYIAPAGVHNAAGSTPDLSVAPGSIISIQGASLAGDTLAGPGNPLAQTIGGVTVTTVGRVLALVSVSPEEIRAQLPFGLPDGDYVLTVSWAGHPDVTATFTVARNAPGLFTLPVDDRPLAMASHEDGTPITFDSPAHRGETVTFLGTGFGPYDRMVLDGFATPLTGAIGLLDGVDILASDIRLQPAWSGAAPGLVGMTATKLKITDDLPSSIAIEVRVQINGKTSNMVLLPLE